VDWIENGKAPDKLIASKKDRGNIVMTRPIYPYPETVVYKGSGDTNSADSFQVKQ
jgi:feruloyl esterase